MSELPQLRQSLLDAAERQAREARAYPSGNGYRQSSHSEERRDRPRGAHGLPRLARIPLARRGGLLAVFLVSLLTLAAVAYAATRLIETGAPVRSEEGFSTNAGAGVAIAKAGGLLGIAAPDPAGGPPWTMRVYKTSRGLGCVQVGRLVGGHIGVLGQDGAFNDDGRFHPLPVQASQAEGDCVLLDGHGHAFLGVGNYGVPASGLPRQCHLLGSRTASERCGRSDPRDVFYGLLGPRARTITYMFAGHLHTIPTVGSEGAYLIVARAPAWLTARGAGAGASGALPVGGGTLDGVRLPQPVLKIAYTGGWTCTIALPGKRDRHGGDCLPPVGYVAQKIHVPSARELASAVDVRNALGEPVAGAARAGRVRALTVSFRAHAAVTSALSGYSVTLQAPESGACRGHIEQANGQVGRNVRAGEHVQLTVASVYADAHSMFPGCPGVMHGRVIYSIPSFELPTISSYGPFSRRHSARVTVGRFTYDNSG
ncbi:MAG: hypothetical protein WBV85_05145 [Solirubrobacteraceae bacterium]